MAKTPASKPKASDTKAKRREKAPKPKKGLVIGDSGTRILSGFIYEEYNPKLQAEKGVEIFDEMRKNDGTVAAAVRACSMPIRSAKWYIEPASDDPVDVEIADFVSDCLFEHQTVTWNYILRHALLSLPLGVIAFEKVYTTTEINGQTYIVWDKLAPRMPRSFIRWAIGDDTPGITQFRSDGETVEIPMEKLIVISNEMEGKNWWGQSILRAAYKHWYIKNTIYKIDAIAHERQGLGVPQLQLPEGYNDADVQVATKVLQNLRANSQAYVITPPGYTIEFMDMKSKTTLNPMPSVEHHNFEMTKSVLAQFLELGEGKGSGSRALSTDMTELFLQALIGVANDIADAFNKHGIKELVDLNFDVDAYPKLVCTNIQELDAQKLATTYQLLVTSGGIKVGSNDEQFFREILELPERDPNEKLDEASPAAQETLNHNPEDDDGEPDMELKAIEDAMDASEPFKKKIFGEYKPYRPLTFAEHKVDFPGINDNLNKKEKQFLIAALALMADAQSKFMEQFTKAAYAGDTKALKDLELKAEQQYARILKNAMRDAFDYGKNNAAREIGSTAPATPEEVVRQIDLQAASIAEQQISQIAGEAKTAYVAALNKDVTPTMALSAADQMASMLSKRLVTDTAAIIIAMYVDHGRALVFMKHTDKIYALQRSEILDSKTCNYCISVDGRVVQEDDPFAQNAIFHSHCRGIWVAILEDEQDKPTIGGIPQSLRDRFTGTVNGLTQPKNPITRANTAARTAAKKRIEKQQ